MSGFFQDLAGDFVSGFFGNEFVRDYTHASKTFRPNAYQYSPKFKFLFHVYFDINKEAYPLGLGVNTNLALTVKTVKLPSYQPQIADLNQYNRKRIVQTKMRYDPIDITFHDDNGNLVRDMWFNYFSYYYNDPNKPITLSAGRQFATPSINGNNGAGTSDNYNTRTLYKPSITGDNGWGYIGETSTSTNSATSAATGQTKIPFFKNVTIFGFNQHNFSAYTLINPLITRFSHDTYDYSQGNGTMENIMTLDYETVKYFSGAIDGRKPADIVKGFGDAANYDKTPSPANRPGANGNILGQGGLIDGAGGVIQDIADGNYVKAIANAGGLFNTYKKVNIKQAVVADLKTGALNSVQNTPNRNSPFQFPSFGQTPGLGQVGSSNGSLNVPAVIQTGINSINRTGG